MLSPVKEMANLSPGAAVLVVLPQDIPMLFKTTIDYIKSRDLILETPLTLMLNDNDLPMH